MRRKLKKMETILNWNWLLQKIILLSCLIITCYSQEMIHKDETGNPTNVILLSYPRSGSSFIGETLAVNANFSYYFEPLFYDKNILHNTSSKQYQESIRKLLNCDASTLDNLRYLTFHIIRKFQETWSTFRDTNVYPKEKLAKLCSKTPIHLTKTIRFRIKDALELYASGTVPNLKIIHLIRDPRARYNSANSKLGTWNEKDKSIDGICEVMERDSKLVDAFPKNVYRRIKYEDVVNDPVNVVRDLYENFLGVDMSPEVKLYIQKHTKAENNETVAREAQQYYSTYRNSDFDHEHWKLNLNPTVIAEIQEKCHNVFIKYDYKHLNVEL